MIVTTSREHVNKGPPFAPALLLCEQHEIDLALDMPQGPAVGYAQKLSKTATPRLLHLKGRPQWQNAVLSIST